MATVKVVKSGNSARKAAPLIRYLAEGEGHQPGIARVLATTSTNGVPSVSAADGWAASIAAFDSVSQRFSKSRAKHEVYHVIVSFGPDELDPKDPDAVARAVAIAHDFAYESWPTRQTLAFVQADGEGGKLHAHFVVANLDLITGKAARDDEMRWTRLAPVMDSVLTDHGMRQPAYMPQGGVIPEYKERGHSQHDRRLIEDGRDPRALIIEAVRNAKASANSQAEFLAMLISYGVEAKLTPPNARQKYGATAYTATNSDGESVTLAGGKLGKGAGWNAIDEALKVNREKTAKHTFQLGDVVEGQDRVAVAAAEISEALNNVAHQISLSKETPHRDLEEDEMSPLSRRRRVQKQPDRMTPARAAFLRQKGVLTREQAREYGG